MIPRLSLRYRMPLNLALVTLSSSLFVAGFVWWHDVRSIDDDADLAGRQFALLLANAVAKDLATGDTWGAYRTLGALFRHGSKNWLLPEYAIVVDDTGNTLVSTEPTRFPIARTTPLPSEGTEPSYRILRQPVAIGTTRLGTLLLAFPKARLWPRYLESVEQIGVATLLFLLLLVPLGWLLGQRISRPINLLMDCVSRLGEDLPGDRGASCPVDGRHGELGQLAQRIREVSAALAERRELERQIAISERQASLGRLAAGIAHEINNPLGGMLNAIAIHKRHGEDPQVTRDTLDLIERGLQQIQGIVSALLVEVRTEQRPLSADDLTDIERLVSARLREKQIELRLRSPAHWTARVPAGPVRQVILNLLLNAIQASPPGQMVELQLTLSDTLTITVTNPGETIPPERQAQIFEPLVGHSPGGHGLGLWITQQIVHQLGGDIRVESADGHTRFRVTLPKEMEHAED
ncbi:MAG: sensor histidine kinase [Gammaproteobacteria bacterium]|nr:MAG: sensor histidine kinase [Gammaproteobacteria bacterium]